MAYINGASVTAIGVIFPVVDSFAVAGRFYSRISHNTNLGVDDWICVPALLLTVALGVVLVYGAAQEIIGYHSPEPTSHEEAAFENSQEELMEKLQVVYELVTPLAIGLIKLAILFCYRRIFSGRAFYIVNWFMIGLVIAWTVVFTIISVAGCGKHIEYLWSNDIDSYSSGCINTYLLVVYMAVTDFVIDILVLAQPLPWVWKIQMTVRRKIAVTSVFLLGLLATAAAVTRAVVQIETNNFDPNSNGTIFGMPGNTDQLGISSVFFFWSYMEIGIAMGICCAPSLRLLVDHLTLATVLSSIRASSPFRSERTPSRVSNPFTTRGTKSPSSSERNLVRSAVASTQASEDLEMQNIPRSHKPSLFRLQRDRHNRIAVVKDVEVPPQRAS